MTGTKCWPYHSLGSPLASSHLSLILDFITEAYLCIKIYCIWLEKNNKTTLNGALCSWFTSKLPRSRCELKPSLFTYILPCSDFWMRFKTKKQKQKKKERKRTASTLLYPIFIFSYKQWRSDDVNTITSLIFIQPFLIKNHFLKQILIYFRVHFF